MIDNNTYTATMTISSVGDSPGVSVEIDTSHDIVDKINRGEMLPASYAAMRDVQRYMRMASAQASANMHDSEFFSLPEEEQMALIEEAARDADKTIVVDRVSLMDE